MKMSKRKKGEQIEIGDIVNRLAGNEMKTSYSKDMTSRSKVRQPINVSIIYEVVHIQEADSKCVIKGLCGINEEQCLLVSMDSLVLYYTVKLGQIVVARGKGEKSLSWYLGMVKRIEKKKVLIAYNDKIEEEVAIKDYDFIALM